MHRSATRGWAAFAATTLLMVAAINLVQGFIAMFMADYFVGFSGNLLFFGFTLWGIGLVVWGLIMLAAGLAMIGGWMWARVFGVIAAAANAVVQLGFIAAHPWWSLVVIAIDLAIVYGLTAGWTAAYGRSQEDKAYRSGYTDATTAPTAPAGDRAPSQQHGQGQGAHEQPMG